jgi:hypothetical protein
MDLPILSMKQEGRYFSEVRTLSGDEMRGKSEAHAALSCDSEVCRLGVSVCAEMQGAFPTGNEGIFEHFGTGGWRNWS